MIVYTVQTEEAWKEFKRKGYIEGNKEMIDPEWLYSYDWMVREAKRRVSHYEGEYPVWVWETHDYPDRNGTAWGRKNEKMVILTLDVPAEWILWSEISYWCCAMTDGSIYNHQKDRPNLEEWFSFMDEEYGIIFDFDFLLHHPDWYLGKENSLQKQGVMGRTPFSFVKKVQRFRAKDPKIERYNKKSSNWKDRNDNRVNKMKRKLRKKVEKQKRIQQKLIRK